MKEVTKDKLIKKSRWPLLILGFLHLLFEVLIQSETGATTSAFPVVVNYFISSAILKYRIRKDKSKNIYLDGAVIYILVFLIRVLFSFVVLSFI